MKRILAIAGIFVMVLSLVAGCSSSATTNSQGSPPISASFPKMRLVLASAYSPSSLQAQESQYFMDEITKRSGGAITFDATWGAAFAPVSEMLGLVSKGAVDLIDWSTGYNATLFPGTDLDFAYPFTTSDPGILMPAYSKLRSEFPKWGTDLYTKQNVKVLTLSAHAFYGIISKFPINTLDDLKGRKVAAIGLTSKIMEAAGAIGVASPAQERYMQMQTGVVEASWLPLNLQVANKIQEVGKYFMEVDALTKCTEHLFMNMQKWNSLNAATQKLFSEVSLDAEAYLKKIARSDYGECLNILKAAGVTITRLPDAERTRWSNFIPDLAADQAILMESNGLPGFYIAQRYTQILKEAGVKITRDYAVRK
jgi:TRAP-type C4-dicarboxylate transport system substrate-binding protein